MTCRRVVPFNRTGYIRNVAGGRLPPLQTHGGVVPFTRTGYIHHVACGDESSPLHCVAPFIRTGYIGDVPGTAHRPFPTVSLVGVFLNRRVSKPATSVASITVNCQLKKIPQPVHEMWKKAVEFVLILGRLGALELQLKPVCNERNKLTVGGLALGVAHRVAKEALQGVQIAPVPGHLDGVANGPLYPAWGSLEGLGYLGVEDLGDGVRGLSAHAGGFQERRKRKGFIAFFIVPYSTALRGVASIIAYSNFIVKFQPNKHLKLQFIGIFITNTVQ